LLDCAETIQLLYKSLIFPAFCLKHLYLQASEWLSSGSAALNAHHDDRNRN
jgi:hypothetical protein